ncbi:MAG: hypothetical protein FWG05_04840 [Kiritimatiellaeota bacterium]|nr:hypothetical protein [Kiritimatiellota bacterium]
MRKSHTVIIAAALAAILPATAEIPKAVLKSIKIDQEELREGVGREFAEMVCNAVGKYFAEEGNVAPENDMLVYQNPDYYGPWPIAMAEPAPGGERIIAINTYSPAPYEIVYQFSHEYCHMFAKHWTLSYGHQNMWLQESICELASLWALYKIGDEWIADVENEKRVEDGKGMKSIVANRFTVLPQFETPEKFREWLETKLPILYKWSKPEDFMPNRIIATHLLKLFLTDPKFWQIVPYINVGQKEACEISEHLAIWRDAVPEELRKYVEKMADWMGYPLSETVTATVTATPDPQ